AGKSEWGNIRTSPAVFNNMLFYAEPYSNTVVAVDGLNGKAAGGLEVGAPMFPQWSSPAIAADTLYVPRFDGGLYAISANKAQLLWSFYLGSPGYAGPKIPEALLGLQDPEWKPPIGDAIYASPAIAADGSILIPAAGFLYCISEE
ncbi:MAG TPA: PQQ-binding-like beta-propeller repeat protein, partial [Candidatus Obscuribacterales bacterium]